MSYQIPVDRVRAETENAQDLDNIVCKITLECAREDDLAGGNICKDIAALGISQVESITAYELQPRLASNTAKEKAVKAWNGGV